MKFPKDLYLFEDRIKKAVNLGKYIVSILSIYVILGLIEWLQKSNTSISETLLLLVFKNLCSKTF